MRVKIDITESRQNQLVFTETLNIREIESRSGAKRIAKLYKDKIQKGQYLWVYFLESDTLHQFTPSQLR